MPSPLSSLESDRCAALRGVVFDIDDTITRGGRLESEAYAAMWRLKAAGLRLIAVTGRPLGWTDVVAHMWPVDLAVGENGAGWACSDGGSLREGYFADAAARREQAELLSDVRRAVARQLPAVKEAGDQRARRCDLAFDVNEHARLDPQQVAELVALIESEGARTTVSSVHCHAVPGAWDKAVGTAAALRQGLGIELQAQIERWLFIGDSRNDSAAFAAFPISVGVANVARYLPDLPVPPRYVTVADRGRGFVEMVDHVLRSRDPTRGAPEDPAERRTQ